MRASRSNGCLKSHASTPFSRWSSRVAGLVSHLHNAAGVSEDGSQMWDPKRDCSLHELFRLARGIWIEPGLSPEPKLGFCQRLACDIALSMSTQTAAQSQTAQQIAAALAVRLSLSDADQAAVATSLHEALRNAVVHGSLALGSKSRVDLEGCAAFEDLVARRTQDPSFAARPITMGLKSFGAAFEIFVLDGGDGYDSGASQGGVHVGHGRGLEIIRALTSEVVVGDGGRLITMRFTP
ncbi:MAG TPA: hypothetical protein DCL54_16660 [Alphaproteobacteria bacterium]|nr:hypothetical protein [Alphaproteobacteria bacterium]HAJ48207.1 hypothetical protein [Alphaproteobacteria bacterium]